MYMSTQSSAVERAEVGEMEGFSALMKKRESAVTVSYL